MSRVLLISAHDNEILTTKRERISLLFSLKNRGAYTWYDVFCILSWNKFDGYLTDLEFPLLQDVHTIRQVAKDFVQRFFNMQPPLYLAGRVSDQAQGLFDETYQTLVTKLGEAKTETLCEWGNQLQIDHRLAYSLQVIMTTMSTITSEMSLPSLSITSRDLVRLLLPKYKEQSRELNNSLDTIDAEVSQDEWGKLIYRQIFPEVVDKHEDETLVGPTDQLATWINFIKARSVIHNIINSLTPDELAMLNNLLQTHASWAEVQSKSSSIYYQPLDLLELAKRI